MKLAAMKLQGKDPHEAGLCLLEELIGEPLPEILRTPMGKPYFANGLVHFSISHTPRYAFCAVSEKPIGIDAEEADRQINLTLAEKILSPMELEQFRQAQDRRLALLTFWVLKEAAGKCTGQGLKVYPNHTAFSLNDPRVQIIDGCLVAVIENEE